MAKQYDRLLNPFLSTRKQDITAFDDHLWRLKVALDRVPRIGRYRRALRNCTVDVLLEETEQVAYSVQQWRGSELNDGEKAVQLGPLREAVYQLEDMADDIEYMQWKLDYMKWKPYQATSFIRRLRLVFKLRKTEELLKDLQVIIEDFQKEFNPEKGKAMTKESMKGSIKKHTHDYTKDHDPDLIPEEQHIFSQSKGWSEISKDRYTNYAVSQISEGKGSGEISEVKGSGEISEGKGSCEISEGKGLGEISEGKGKGEISEEKGSGEILQEKHSNNKSNDQHNTKDDLVERLLQQGGDLVIPFDVAQEAEKTTITVDDIFRDPKISENFDLLLRIRASDGPSSTISYQGTLAESILKLMHANVVNVQGALHKEKCGKCRSCSNTKNEVKEVKELQEKFCQLSEQKKFLLVLEDVLEDQLPQLDRLLSALLCGNSGSRIVISSQSSEVLQSVRSVKISNDGNIQRDIFWNFFRIFAFRDAKETEDEKMKHTAKMIVAHLNFLPLAVKMVAKMLNTKRDHQFWTAILGKLRRVVKTDCEHRQLLSLMKICYDELPAPLRLCFQYCSLFPNNWTFTSENLIQLWMSQGFLVEDSNKVETVEDVGMRYFDELFSRSFFEELIDDGHTSWYRLHISVHCFAQVAAGDEFMRIESDIRPEESLCVRHLSVKPANLSALYNLGALFRLRSLIIFGPINSDDREILHHILHRLKNTRTIDLAGCDVNEFPELADDLRKHLRFLSIYDTGIDKLPDDFYQFSHLQVLNVQGSRVKKLPPKMTRLCNLRHISGPTFLTSAVNHIGKLKDLQELEEFAVSKKNQIKELGGIKDLRGSISITNLERVWFTDAAKAKLHEKSSLNSLKLEWSDTVMHKSVCGFIKRPIQRLMSAIVLERLKPNSDIHILEINRYIGDKSPSWFTAEVLKKIETITLTNCMKLVEPPPLGQLPCLKTLTIGNWKELRSFAPKTLGRFPELIELSLEDMPKLEVWEDFCGSFPKLELLTIRHCRNLKKIPLLKSLEEIYVEEVGLEDLPLPTDNQVERSISCLDNPKSLRKLTMQGCSDISAVGYLPSTLLHLRITACKNIKRIDFKAPISLQELHIDGCGELMKLTINSDKGDLTSLRTVHLDNISLLKPYYKHLVCLEELVIEGEISDSLDELPKSCLRKLCLIRCKDESFFIKREDEARPNDMEEFTSLKCLHLKQCNKMKSLPYLPYNLDELRVDKCPLLEKQCREDGPGWSNISHVPYKYI